MHSQVVNRWSDGWTVAMARQTQMDGRMDKWESGWADRQVSGWLGGRMSGWNEEGVR